MSISEIGMQGTEQGFCVHFAGVPGSQHSGHRIAPDFPVSSLGSDGVETDRRQRLRQFRLFFRKRSIQIRHTLVFDRHVAKAWHGMSLWPCIKT
jgi:hypothetical protein